jgi:hypothetical protein
MSKRVKILTFEMWVVDEYDIYWFFPYIESL